MPRPYMKPSDPEEFKPGMPKVACLVFAFSGIRMRIMLVAADNFDGAVVIVFLFLRKNACID